MVFRKPNQSTFNNDNTSDDIDELEFDLFNDDYIKNSACETHQSEGLFFDFNINKQELIQDTYNDGIHISLFNKDLQQSNVPNNIKNIENPQNNFVFTIQDEDTQKPESKISTIQSFIDYLNLKINKDRKKKISKDILLYLYKHLKEHVNFDPLTRDEKRIKEKLIIKLYKYSKQINECFELNPDEFLVPIIVCSLQKNNQRIINAKRKKFRKKFFC